MALTREEFDKLYQSGFTLQQIADVDSRDTMENSSPSTKVKALTGADRVAQAQAGRPNLLKEFVKKAIQKPIVINPIDGIGRTLQFAGGVGQAIESAAAAPGLAMLQGKNPLTAAPRSLVGTPVELGDIGRQLGAPEPVNVLGGLAASMLLPGIGATKALGKVAGKELPAGAADIASRLNAVLGKKISRNFSNYMDNTAKTHMRGLNIPAEAASDAVKQRFFTDPLTGKVTTQLGEESSEKAVTTIDKKYAQLKATIDNALSKKYDELGRKYNDVNLLTNIPNEAGEMLPATHLSTQALGDLWNGRNIAGLSLKKGKWVGDDATAVGLQKLLDEVQQLGDTATYKEIDRLSKRAESLIKSSRSPLYEVNDAVYKLKDGLTAIKDVIPEHAELSKLYGQLGYLERGNAFRTPLDRFRLNNTPSLKSGRPIKARGGSYSLPEESIKTLRDFEDYANKNFPNLQSSGLLDEYKKASLQRLLSSEEATKSPSVAAVATLLVRNPLMLGILYGSEALFTPSRAAKMWQKVYGAQSRTRALLAQPRAQALENLLNLGVSGMETQGASKAIQASASNE